MDARELERLLIRIVGDSSGAQVEIGKAVQALADAQRRMTNQLAGIDRAVGGLQRSFGVLTKVAGAFGIALSVRGLVNFTKGALDAAGGLGELSQQLGVGIEQLQVYQYAATQAGLSQGDLQTALSKLSRTIGEAAAGEKEASDAFARLGISVRDANGNVRATDDVLRDVAERFKSLPDAAQQAAAAADLFGRSGQKMLPILADGAAGLQRFEDRARKLGIVLSKEQSDAADKASDKWAEFSFVLGKLAQRVAVDLAPAMAAVFDTLNKPEVIQAITDLFRGLAEAIRIAAVAFAGFAEAIPKGAANTLIEGVIRNSGDPELIAKLDEVTGGKLKELAKQLDELNNGNGGGGGGGGGLLKTTKDALAELTKAADAANESLAKESLLTVAASQGEKATRELKAALATVEAINKALEGSNRTPAQFWGTDDLKEQVRLAKGLAGGITVATNEIDKQAAAIARATFAQQRLTDATIDSQKRAELWADAVKSGADAAAEQAEKFAKDVRRVSEGIADDLTTALFEGGKSGFDDILENVGAWVRRIGLEIIKQKLILPITMELVSAVPGLFGIGGSGTAGTPGGTNIFGAVTSLATDAFDWIGRTLGFGPSAGPAVAGAGGRIPGGGVTSGGSGTTWLSDRWLSDALGSAALGYGIGSLVGSFSPFGRTGPGSSIGGALGGLAGSFLDFIPGGDIIGGLLGSLVGSLFGPKPSSGPFGLGTAKASGGRLAYTTTSNLKGGVGDLSPLVNETIGVANQLADLFGAEFADAANVRIGYVNAENGAKGYVVGGARPAGSDPNYVFNNWKNFGENKQAAELFAIKQAVLGGTFNGGINNGPGLQGLSAEEKQYLTKSFDLRKSTEEVLKDAQLIVDLFGDQAEAMSEAAAAIKQVNDAYDAQIDRAKELGISETELVRRRDEAIQSLKTGFVEGIQDQILAITDPVAFAIKQLDKDFETIRANAEDFGVGLVEVEQLYGLKRQQILEQYAQTTVSDLQKFLEQLRFGDLSGADPTARLQGARSAFEAAAAQALAGDATARGRIQDLGTTFLNESRGYNASSGAYYSDVERVRSVVEQLLGGAPGYADGTLSAAGGLSWVGERGRELMVLPRGAGIIPNAISETMASRAANGDGWRPLLRAFIENVTEGRRHGEILQRIEARLRDQGSAIARLRARLPAEAA